MNAGLQQKIAPVTPSSGTRAFNDVNVAPSEKSTNPIDFRDLLQNSNHEIKLERESQKKGDLSAAKDFKGFIDSVNGPAKKGGPKNAMGKDDFLKLFVAQLQNQDPLAPKDGSEMASQLAQFNSLEQMINMNKALERIDSGAKQSHQMNLISYLGKDALTHKGITHFEGGKIQEAYFDLAHPTNNLEFTVKNGQGNTIYTESLGSLKAGQHALKWDGSMDDGSKAKDGNYTLTISTQDDAGNEIPISVTSRLQLEGLSLTKDSSEIRSNAGTISLEDIVSLEERKLTKETPPQPLTMNEILTPGQTPNAPLPQP